MRAQRDGIAAAALLDEERILHIAGRVILRKVERGEIVPVVFDLGSVGDGEADARKDLQDAFADERDGVARAEGHRLRGKCEVDVGRGGLIGCGFEHLLEGSEFRFGGLFQFVDLRAVLLLLLGGNRFHRREQLRQDALLTQEAQTKLLDFLTVGGGEVGDFVEVGGEGGHARDEGRGTRDEACLPKL